MFSGTVVGRVMKISEVREVKIDDKVKEVISLSLVFNDYLNNAHYVTLEFWGSVKKVQQTYRLGDLLCAIGTVKAKPYLSKEDEPKPKCELVLVSPTVRKITN